jgi:hypothetical protein
LFGEDTHHWALARIAFARQPHVPRTTHLDLFSLKAPGNCENRDESFVTFNESKNRPLTLLVPGNHVQRGIRIIVTSNFFATSFSVLFQVVFDPKFPSLEVVISKSQTTLQ